MHHLDVGDRVGMERRLWLDPIELVARREGVDLTVWRTDGRGTTLTPDEIARRLAGEMRQPEEWVRELLERVVDGLAGRVYVLDLLHASRIEVAFAGFRGIGPGGTLRLAEGMLRVFRDIVREDGA